MEGDRERFNPDELAVVLSHYDLGVIRSAKEFPRGSRRAPKLLLRNAEGRRYLLKRRAGARSDPFKVAFAHALAGHLTRRGFPVPGLLGTRDDQNSMLEVNGHVYELFEYAEGGRYDGSQAQTADSGALLARFHQAVEGFRPDFDPPEGSYHDAAAVRHGLNAIPTATEGHDSVVGHEAELLATLGDLHERYDRAAAEVRACGFVTWRETIIHGDWHPGNLLFSGERASVVLDLDSARRQPAVVDVANGMLQFSILRARTGPDTWPDAFDDARMRTFLDGYATRQPISREQRRALLPLMTESLIAESVLPIARTGSFGWLPGFGVLRMVRRKAGWLEREASRLESWMVESQGKK